MASIAFEVRHEFAAPPRTVWDELIDWEGHGAWVPMTRVEVEPGDPHAVGARFTAWTGPWKLALEDRMEVVRCDWSEPTSSGDCEVRKLGPVLQGRAGFTVEPDGDGAVLNWIEDVTVPYVPQFLAPIVEKIGAFAFGQGMRKLSGLVATTSPAS
jgi:carbon monoxide dehydrogenase subunit G